MDTTTANGFEFLLMIKAANRRSKTSENCIDCLLTKNGDDRKIKLDKVCF